MKSYRLRKKKKIPPYEHLDVNLKLSYAQRLRCLEEMIDFVRLVEKKRIISKV